MTAVKTDINICIGRHLIVHALFPSFYIKITSSDAHIQLIFKITNKNTVKCNL